MTPRVVFGVPLFQGDEHLPEALESLLGQRGVECAFVCVDDGGGDRHETARIVEGYAREDHRLHYDANARRLGLALNWRRAFEAAVERYPGAEYFAWGSDHDVWHPDYARRLVRALDRRPDATLAYAREAVLTPERVLHPRRPAIDTSGIGSRTVKLWRLAREMRAGQMVYGVFRVEALHRAAGLRQVLFPDRLVLTEAALQGQLIEVPEVLWYRRKIADFSVERQVKAIFPDGAPLWSHLPWWLTHSGVLARNCGPGAAVLFLAANGSRAAAARLRA
jgi:glycosyltransferase involved in cell wall biosynthesis